MRLKIDGTQLLPRPSYVSITPWQDSDYTGGCQGYWLASLTCQSHHDKTVITRRLSWVLTPPPSTPPLSHITRQWLHWRLSRDTGLAPLTCQSHMTRQWLHSPPPPPPPPPPEAVKDTDSPLLRVNHTWQDSDYTGGCHRILTRSSYVSITHTNKTVTHRRLSRILTRPSYVSITHDKTVITLEAVKDTDSPLLRVNHKQDSDYTGGCQGYWLAPLTCQSDTRQWLHRRLSRILTRPSYVSITHNKTVITLEAVSRILTRPSYVSITHNKTVITQEAVKDTDSVPLTCQSHTRHSDYTGGCQGILTRPSYASITHNKTVITQEAVKDTDSPLLRGSHITRLWLHRRLSRIPGLAPLTCQSHTTRQVITQEGCQGYWLAPLTCQSHMTRKWLHRRLSRILTQSPLLRCQSHMTRQWLHRRLSRILTRPSCVSITHNKLQWLHWRLSRILTRPSYVSIRHDKTVITQEAVKDTDSPLLRVNHTWQDSDYTGGCQGYWLAPLTRQSHMTRQWLHRRLSRILTRPSYYSITHKTMITLEAVKDTDSAPLYAVNHTQDSDYTGGCQGYWLAPLTCQSHMTRQWLHRRLSRILTRPSYVSITHDKTVITQEAVKDTDSPLLRDNHTQQDSDYTGGWQGYWLAPLTCPITHDKTVITQEAVKDTEARPSYVSITHNKTVITQEADKDTDSPLLRDNHTQQDSDYTGGWQGYWLAPLTCQSHTTRQWLHRRLTRILTRPSYVSVTHSKTVITLEAVKDTDSPLLRVNHTQDSDYTGGCQGYWLAPLTCQSHTRQWLHWRLSRILTRPSYVSITHKTVTSVTQWHTSAPRVSLVRMLRHVTWIPSSGKLLFSPTHGRRRRLVARPEKEVLHVTGHVGTPVTCALTLNSKST